MIFTHIWQPQIIHYINTVMNWHLQHYRKKNKPQNKHHLYFWSFVSLGELLYHKSPGSTSVSLRDFPPQTCGSQKLPGWRAQAARTLFICTYNYNHPLPPCLSVFPLYTLNSWHQPERRGDIARHRLWTHRQMPPITMETLLENPRFKTITGL